MGKMASVDLVLLDRELELDINTWQQLNILSHKHTKYCRKLTRLNKPVYLAR